MGDKGKKDQKKKKKAPIKEEPIVSTVLNPTVPSKGIKTPPQK